MCELSFFSCFNDDISFILVLRVVGHPHGLGAVTTTTILGQSYALC